MKAMNFPFQQPKDKLKPDNWRVIYLLSHSENVFKSISNEVKSAKYTLWNLIPKNIFIQFSDLWYFWFLFISILQLHLSTTNIYNSAVIIPFMVLLFITLISDAYHDIPNHIHDNYINNKEYLVCDGFNFVSKKSKDIKIGDVIQIREKEACPADILLLCVKSGESEIYVDMLGVIGESSFESKKPIKETMEFAVEANEFEVIALISRIKAIIKIPVNKTSGEFKGSIRLESNPKSSALSASNYIPQGAKLIDSEWILGVVIYTYENTGNKLKFREQFSAFNKRMNKIVFVMMCFAAILILITVIYNIFNSNYWKDEDTAHFIASIIILYSYLIPISLFITFRTVKLIFSFSLRKFHDIHINSLSSLQDAGQVEYILADKTGTLTNGDIKLQTCIVAGDIYIRDSSDFCQSPCESYYHHDKSDTRVPLIIPELLRTNSKNFKSFADLKTDFMNSESDSVFYHFLICMAVCNSTFMRSDKTSSPISNEEKAMIEASKDLGIKLKKKSTFDCDITILDEELKLKIIGHQRKSHSVKKSRIIISNPKTETSILYISGSNEAMMKLFYETSEDVAYIDDLLTHSEMADKKIIVFGLRKLSKKETEEFEIDYHNFKLLPAICDKKIEDLFTKLEKEAKFLGAVGLEETVLDETKETIETLTKAGIKIWILSGDNEENTLSVGVTSGLLKSSANISKITPVISLWDCTVELIDQIKINLFHLTSNTNTGVSTLLKDESSFDNNPHRVMSNFEMLYQNSIQHPAYSSSRYVSSTPYRVRRKSKVRRRSVNPFLISNISKGGRLRSPLADSVDPSGVSFVLSIDRSVVEYGLKSEENRKYLAALLCSAESVCFHSLLPSDKATIVRFLRTGFSYDPTTLAIGDESSDIEMIKTAHLGVGIVRSSTEHVGHAAIQRFSQLKELLLYHGHTKFIILSKVIMLSFFVNYLITFIMLFYCNSSYSNCDSMLDQDLLDFYLFFLILIPIVGSELFDEDLSSRQIYKFPQVYTTCNHYVLLGTKKFIMLIVAAALYAVIIYWPIYLIQNLINDKGFTLDIYTMEIIIFLTLYGASMAYIIVEVNAFNMWTICSYLVSIISLIIFLNVKSNDYKEEEFGILDVLYESPLLWIYFIIFPLMCLTISFFFKFYLILFHPRLVDLIKVKGKNIFSLKVSSRLEEFKDKMESVYKKSTSFKHNHDSYAINPWTLKFRSKMVESDFQIYSNHNSNNFRIFLWCSYLSFLGLEIYEISNSDTPESFGIFIIVTFFIYFVLLVLSLTSLFQIYHKEMVILAVSFNMIIYCINIFQYKIIATQLYLYWSPLFLLGVSGIWIEMNFVTFITIFLYGGCIIMHSQIDPVYVIEVITLYIAVSSISSARVYIASKTKRIRWTFLKKVDSEMEKSEQVLNFVLPAFVRKRVKDGIRYIAEDQGVVSILFCDIDDFEDIISNYPSSEITQFLDEIYRKFDNICDNTGVTKIETVGNVYMACAGLKDSEIELSPYFRSIPHSRRCVEMGLKILSTVEKIFLSKGEPLKVKIGIHTGPVTAGVVGYHKPQFSLVGDTVNTASRMASTLTDSSKIQISENTYSHLGDYTGLSFIKKSISVKGKGQMNTVLVSLNQSPEDDFKDMVPLLPTVQVQWGNNSPIMRASLQSSIRLDSIPFSNHSTILSDRKSSDLSTSNIKIPKEDFNIEDFCPFNINETHEDRIVRHQMLRNYSSALIFGNYVGLVSCFILVLTNLADAINEEPKSYKIADLCFFSIETIIYAVTVTVIKRMHTKKLFSITLEIFYALSIIAKIIIEFWQTETSEEFSAITSIFLMYFILLQCTGLFFKNLFVVSLSLAIFWIISLFFSNHMFAVQEAIMVLGYTTIVQFVTFYREKNLRRFLAIENASNREIEKIEALLTQMMPPHVFRNLREEIAIADTFSNVTMLYADIAGFTLWSSNKEAKEVVGMLSEFFTRFDKLCVEFNVYKVHTIGDCYVAMGLNGTDYERNPSQECLNIINFAQALLQTIDIVNDGLILNLKMRVGIHTGSIIGGIAGANIIRYDIFGSDVLIANKMESNGVPGAICISEDSMMVIDNYKPGAFKFRFHQEVDIPSVNRVIKTYLLKANEDQSA
ncbi:unnamed protein product [Blepharisma stoltei]|uniref:Guanylate cyclase domain-containing protein n=1 Tax=Blepharisma stoltei TaxID=1481888 RepID=A0AAU9KCX3_9CILI|nr:unnamed protein product [Blepharisma stoltei]